MKETYLSRDFRKTVARHFPIEARELNAAFEVRLNGLLAENADASKEERYHLKKQILPGIAERLRPFGGLCRCFCDSDDISYAGSHRDVRNEPKQHKQRNRDLVHHGCHL